MNQPIRVAVASAAVAQHAQPEVDPLFASDDVDMAEGQQDDGQDDAETGAFPAGMSEAEDDQDISSEEDEEIGVFEIYNRKCLNCISLCAELAGKGGKEHTSCHFTNGNEDCPARFVQVIVGVPVNRLVRAILESEETGDSERLATIYSKIATKDPTVQTQVYQALAEARAAR
jgi:hypothetical protein